MRKRILIITNALFLIQPALTAKKCKIILNHGLNPRLYVSTMHLPSNGRGNLIPPIGSKIFIAWRNRTPSHIPDSAYFAWWIKEKDVLRITLEAGDVSESKPVTLTLIRTKNAVLYVPSATQDFATFIKKKFPTIKLNSKDNLINGRALTFFDKTGIPLVFLLDKDKNHNLAAKQILVANPELFFYSADNLSFKVNVNPQGIITKIVTLKTSETSPHLSDFVLSRSVPIQQIKILSEKNFLQEIFLSSAPHLISPQTHFGVDASIPRAPSRPLHTLN